MLVVWLNVNVFQVGPPTDFISAKPFEELESSVDAMDTSYLPEVRYICFDARISLTWRYSTASSWTSFSTRRRTALVLL